MAAHRTLAVCAALAAGLASPGSGAEENPLSLPAAARVTLGVAPEIALARAVADAQQGVVVREEGAFDWSLGAESAWTQRSCAGGARPADAALRSTAEMGRRFGNGASAAPFVTAERSDCASLGVESLVGVAGLRAEMPLLRGRGAVARAALASAEHSYSARQHGIAQAQLDALLATVEAYWDYRAAVDAAAVVAGNEAIGRKLVEETTRLVERHQAPASDLLPVRAALADRTRARLEAERAVVTARLGLGVAMGLGEPEAHQLGLPGTPFPPPPTPLGDLDGLFATAQAQRPDLAANAATVASLEAALGTSDPRPALNLAGSVQYTAIDGDLAATLAGPALLGTGPSATLGLALGLPVQNRVLRGSLAANRAALDQAKVDAANQLRQVRAALRVDLATITYSAEALASADQARALYAAASESENLRVRAGVATVIGLLLIQDRAVEAELEVIAMRRQLAVAAARLAYDLGDLATLMTPTPVGDAPAAPEPSVR